MTDSDLFSQINTAILHLQASGLQNFHRPIKRLAQLLHHQDLRAVNQQLTAIVDVDAFLQINIRPAAVWWEVRSFFGRMISKNNLAFSLV